MRLASARLGLIRHLIPFPLLRAATFLGEVLLRLQIREWVEAQLKWAGVSDVGHGYALFCPPLSLNLVTQPSKTSLKGHSSKCLCTSCESGDGISLSYVRVVELEAILHDLARRVADPGVLPWRPVCDHIDQYDSDDIERYQHP